jgi:hypothetical protein
VGSWVFPTAVFNNSFEPIRKTTLKRVADGLPQQLKTNLFQRVKAKSIS